MLDSQGHEARVLTNKPVPQTTGQYPGHDTSLPRAPNYLPTLAGSEVGDDSSQGALDTQFSEALDSLWSGDDVNSSLMEMLWDDLWLTAPSFF